MTNAQGRRKTISASGDAADPTSTAARPSCSAAARNDISPAEMRATEIGPSPSQWASAARSSPT
jgi:hypothetical protein